MNKKTSMLSCQEDSYRTKDVVTITKVQYKTKQLPQVDLCISSQLFYPEGGGQSGDRGFLQYDSWIFEVLDTQKYQPQDQNHTEILLHCQIRKDHKNQLACEELECEELECHDMQLLLNELNGKEVLACIDWEARFDSMQQHSGQHVLTATILELYGWKTVGFHIGSDLVTIDLDVDIASFLEDNERIRIIETAVNEKIRSAIPISQRWLKRLDFEMDWKNGKIRSRGVPEHVQDDIRVIEIAGVDANNCGGTHVKNTSELQVCLIVEAEKLQDATRLYFLYGNRAIRHMHNLQNYQQSMTKILNQHSDSHCALVEQSLKQRKQQGKHIEKLQIMYVEQKYAVLPLDTPKIVICFEPLCSRGNLSLMHRMIREKHKDGILLLGVPDGFLFDVSDTWFSKIADHKSHILEIIDGKGGGRPPIWQGKTEALTEVRLTAVADLLRKLLGDDV